METRVNRWLSKIRVSSSDLVVAALIFASTLAVFWFSPVRQVSDSRYSMLLSESLLRHKSFALDNYDIPHDPPVQREDYLMNGQIYQLEIMRGRLYYFFPPGSSVLSVPYVAIANAFGLTASNPDNTYNHQGEIAIETGLAAILMAALTVFFFATARLFLPLGWSVLVALGGSLGTQIYSTASRGLWSHTWGVLLLGIVIYLLANLETGSHKPRPVLLATLLAWMYFVRPSNSIFIIAVSIYILLYYRRMIIPFALTGIAWLAGFMVYSWHNFGHLLPSYYRANRLRFDVFKLALTGNLISPARGVLVFVPVTIFVVFLLVRYRKDTPQPRLLWLAILVSLANLITISGFTHWWGGASYGPRFSTDAVPWFVLMAILGLRAMLNWRERHSAEASSLSWSLQLIAGATLLLASVFINARGALSIETWKWNEEPSDVVLIQKKLWDWRQPQFLAGLIRPPLDRDYPLISLPIHIDFTKREAEKYLWYGWSNGEQEFRWTSAREAAMVFALDRVESLTLKMKVLPFLHDELRQQRMTLLLNYHPIQSVTLNENKPSDLSFKLPKNLLTTRNVITIKVPDAISPQALHVSVDDRPLGIAAYWVELQSEAPLETIK